MTKRRRTLKKTVPRRTVKRNLGINFNKEQRLLIIEKFASDDSDESIAIKKKVMK
jgi:hypothetical protein